MRAFEWTPEKDELLKQLFPHKHNIYIAELMGYSLSTIKKRAKALGLKKAHKTEWIETAESVALLFEKHSFREIAKMLGISVHKAHYMASFMGLKRSKEEWASTISRKRNELIRRERFRMDYGFSRQSSIKITSNRRRSKLKNKLKSSGYIVERCNNVVYYSDDTIRLVQKEENGLRLGLKFFPVIQVESTTLTAI